MNGIHHNHRKVAICFFPVMAELARRTLPAPLVDL